MSQARRNNRRQAAKLRRTLQRAPEEITKELKEAFLEASQVVQFDAISFARSDRVKQALADPKAIGVTSGGFKVSFGLRVRRQKKLAFMAHWEEWGTRPHSLKTGSRSGGRGRSEKRLEEQSGGWHPGMHARPFLTPAAMKNRAANRRIVHARVRKAIKRSLGHG